MIDKQALESFIERQLDGTDLFLTALKVSADNTITVEIDSDSSVDIDKCVALTRAIEGEFDRDADDYELEVGSAGITSPLKVTRQYVKNIGKRVEVLTRDGRKLKGTLTDANTDGFSLEIISKVKEPGAKRPVMKAETLTLAYADTKSVVPEIDFK